MVPRMIVALLVAQMFAAGALTLSRNDGVLDVSLIPAWGALGFIEVAVVTALAWHFGIVPEWTVPAMAILVALTFASIIHRGAAPKAIRVSTRPAWNWYAVASLLFVALYAFPILFASAWMGMGDAPPVFFNVDSPYYLSQVHALARSESYPPFSLNTLGVVKEYHYGAQLSAALLTRFGGLAAHKALFWVVVPMFLLGKLAVVWRLASITARSGVPHCLAVLCLLFMVAYPVGRIYFEVLPLLFVEPMMALRQFGQVIFAVERFDTGFPMASTLVGSFIAYLTALLICDQSLKFRFSAIVITVGFLPIFKPPHFVAIGAFVGSWAIYQLVVLRRIGALIAAAGAFGLGVISLRQGSGGNVLGSVSLKIDFDVFEHSASWLLIIGDTVLEHAVLLMTVAIYVTVLSALAAWKWSRAGAAGAKNESDWYNNSAQPIQTLTAVPWFFIVVMVPIVCLPYILVANVAKPDGTIFETPDTFQWLTPVPWIVAFVTLLQAARVWPLLRREGRRVAGTLLIALTTLPVIAKVYESDVLLSNPVNWHEFADNEAILPALARIPLKGSVIVTNDVRYPANAYSRVDRQFQIAALFGHQAYAAVLNYDPSPDLAKRREEQNMLQRPAWDHKLTDIACRRGWTHVLLSKRVPYVRSVPGKLLYDGPRYMVFKLANCSELPVPSQ